MALNDSSPFQAANSIQDNSYFKRAMSKRARRLLECMLEWSNFYHMKWGGNHAFMGAFGPEFDALVYENICHAFKVESYFPQFTKTKIRKAVPGEFKTKEDVLRAMRLEHFQDRAWISELDLKESAKQVMSLETPRAHQVYNWLTTNFVITDFSEDDLNKIAMLGDDRYTLEMIKREATKIHDVQKRSIAYLYAIVRDVTDREEYSRKGLRSAQEKNDELVKQLFRFEAEAKNKLVHPRDEDMRSKWEQERAFIDILREDPAKK